METASTSTGVLNPIAEECNMVVLNYLMILITG